MCSKQGTFQNQPTEAHGRSHGYSKWIYSQSSEYLAHQVPHLSIQAFVSRLLWEGLYKGQPHLDPFIEENAFYNEYMNHSLSLSLPNQLNTLSFME